MTGELNPTLATRAALVMRNLDEGERYIPWRAFDLMPIEEVHAFQAALKDAMARDMRLEVKVLKVEGRRNGLVIKWRRR